MRRLIGKTPDVKGAPHDMRCSGRSVMVRSILPVATALLLGASVVSTPAAAYQVFNGWWCLTTNDSKCKNVLGAASDRPENAREPFLCRFGAAEEGAPVLLAATRADCQRAGGALIAKSNVDATAQ
jgi:hypothetical protein